MTPCHLHGKWNSPNNTWVGKLEIHASDMGQAANIVRFCRCLSQLHLMDNIYPQSDHRLGAHSQDQLVLEDNSPLAQLVDVGEVSPSVVI